MLYLILGLTIVLAAVYLITFKGSFNLNVLGVYDFRSENAQASFIPSQVIALLTKLFNTISHGLFSKPEKLFDTSHLHSTEYIRVCCVANTKQY